MTNSIGKGPLGPRARIRNIKWKKPIKKKKNKKIIKSKAKKEIKKTNRHNPKHKSQDYLKVAASAYTIALAQENIPTEILNEFTSEIIVPTYISYEVEYLDENDS